MDRALFKGPCPVKCGERVSCTYKFYKVVRQVETMVFHTYGILASLCNVEREDARPIEILALLGHHVHHGKPLHSEMNDAPLTVKFENHGVRHCVRALEVSCRNMPFTLFHWAFFMIERVFHQCLEVFMFDPKFFQEKIRSGQL